MSISFLGDADEPFFANLHIDNFSSVKDKKNRVDYHVMLSLVSRPSSPPPKELRDRAQKISWLFARLEAMRVAPSVCLVDIEAVTRASPHPVAAVPLSIGGRPVPLVGAEYRVERPKVGEVRRFRWSIGRDGTTTVWASYLWEMATGERIANLWELHAKLATKYVEEALRQ